MMMPNIDGAELFEHLVASHPDTKVVLTSGYNEREATRRITDDGLAVFLKKPYRPNELVAQLDDLLTPPRRAGGRLRRLLRRGAR